MNMEPGLVEKVLSADLANIMKKVKSGKPLSNAERAILEAKRNGAEPPASGVAKNKSELARSCGITRQLLQHYSKMAGFPQPDEAGRYNVAACISFIRSAGGMKVQGGGESELIEEKIRKTRAEADILEVERARVRNEVIEVETVFNFITNRDLAIRRVITTSKLSTEEQDQVLHELRSIKLEDILEQREFDKGTPSETVQ